MQRHGSLVRGRDRRSRDRGFGLERHRGPALSPTCPAAGAPGSIGVDVELVMAVDISYSMDFDELTLQRDGYVQALASQEFLNALKQGMHGKVAVTMVEWAGVNDQRIVLPWRLIDGPASAQAVAAELARRRCGAPSAPRSPARCCSPPRCSRATGSPASAA